MSNIDAGASRRRTGWLVLLLLIVFFLSFGGGFALHRAQERRAAAARRPMGVFWEAWEILEEGFYGELPTASQRTYGAIRGLLAVLDDPYTVFLEPKPSSLEHDRLAGTYGGIGVDLWRDARGVILSPFPDSPAEAAGVEAGDVLLAVDGQTVLSDTLDAVRVRLRGEVSTTVTLTLSRDPAPPFDLTVERAEIRVPSVTYRVLDQDPEIGYLHITASTGRTADEATEAVNALLAAGVTGIVLDLRGNYGGLIQPAVDVAGLFVDGDVVLYEIRRGGEESTVHADSGGPASELALAILVDGSTASAAEIVAGVLQAGERGILFGEPTFGKGSIQLIYSLSDGSSLHVTVSKWLLPDRQPIGADGLYPDVLVAQSDGVEDAALERALHYLQTGE